MPAIERVYRDHYVRKPKPLPEDPTLRRYVESVLRDSYVIIPDVFTAAEADEAVAEIDRLQGKNPRTGLTPFDGFKTNHILGLLGKTRVFDKFCLLPQVHALNGYFPQEDYLLYIMETIVINPGERNQFLHHDDSVTRLPRPRPAVSAATMIGDDRIGEEHEAVTAVCPKGSVVYFLGTTWHSGGANRMQKPRYAATIQYCQPWIGPVENLMIVVDPRRALSGEIPKRIVDMMGYRSAIPFVGYADGLYPRKATRRLVRWLQGPVNMNPPTLASEDGEKEHKVLSKL
ncbi:hypothetical protein CCHL11_03063 [Colletotrichum chlorophyti]|uniref:Phytanoyl-CoA dioxygenase n=1 Tax=Colletotrichum chlorophyti TaxID=708187 RepID=A0A1Q8RFZ9_9PEZI|nr:hypothetical protein CCHL11_03063 [Colletotrichum chlorophyti]